MMMMITSSVAISPLPLCSSSCRKSFPSAAANFLTTTTTTKISNCYYSSRTFPRLFSLKQDDSSLAQTLLYWAQKNYETINDVVQEEEEEKESLWDSLRRKAFNFSPQYFVAETPLDAVVKVFCVSTEPNFLCPWQREQEYSSSSGFIIRGRRVLTCAHSVDHHIEVKLKKHNSDTLYTAIVLAVAPECDLAMLTVNDDEFWKGVKPSELGDIPTPKDKIRIMGYPDRRDDVVVISGRVSSVGMTSYCHWQTKLLALQVNVGLKEGNSGGPIFNERGKCVGMAFQSTYSTGDIIAAPVIKHFIQDYEKNGAYTGFPSLGISWQEMENPDLRRSMKMGLNQQGILVTQLKPNYPESEILKPCDVILSIDGVNIGNDGTVPFSRGRHIEFSYLISEKYKDDKLDIKILRDSKTREFSIKLATHKQFKPANIIGRPLSYYIIAGFVFTTLSVPYLQSVYERFYGFLPEDLLSKALYEEPVVICKVLKADINMGYDEESIVHLQVLTFNSKPV